MRRVSLGALFTPPPLSPSFVRLGDIDGDGKVDYVYYGNDETGSYPTVTAWRNGGVGVPTFWQSLGVIFNDSRISYNSDLQFVCIYSTNVALSNERIISLDNWT
jgi:hypothetical protein